MSVLIRDCPHCPAQHSSFRLAWSDHREGNQTVWYCSGLCGACGRPICFIAIAKSPSNHSKPTGINGNIEGTWEVKTIWPSRTSPKAPPHTPPAVKTRYEEGEDAFTRGKWNSAVAMYRSALDIATKGMKGVPKGTFFERLAWLHEHHAITPDIHSWATPCQGRRKRSVARSR